MTKYLQGNYIPANNQETYISTEVGGGEFFMSNIWYNYDSKVVDFSETCTKCADGYLLDSNTCKSFCITDCKTCKLD